MGKFNYVRETNRSIPSIVTTYRPITAPPEEEPPAEEVPLEPVPPVDDEPKHDDEEVTPMEPIKDEEWEDPEKETNVILERIAALLSVKSLITIALTVAFIQLVVSGQELPDQFVSIYTMCISFFFGYQFKKAEGGEK